MVNQYDDCNKTRQLAKHYDIELFEVDSILYKSIAERWYVEHTGYYTMSYLHRLALNELKHKNINIAELIAICPNGLKTGDKTIDALTTLNVNGELHTKDFDKIKDFLRRNNA